MVTVTLIRHGQTPGNVRQAYSGGRSEEVLTKEGSEALERAVKKGLYPRADALYVSPMARCLLTAAILYPGREAQAVPGMRECDFGTFEGKNYEELNGRPDYQAWVDSGGMLPFPGGESLLSFQERCSCAFEAVLLRECAGEMKETKQTEKLEQADRNLVFVVHGGTIMALMNRYAVPEKPYFDYQAGNAEGYICALAASEPADPRAWRLSVIREIRL